MRILLLIAIALISYFLGGLNGAIISSKFIFKKDVRDFGSGNAGLTNFYRTFGKMGIVLVLAVDILKSVVAVLLGGVLLGTLGHPLIGKLFAGFCLILGHMYPVYYQFRGGKGVLCIGVTVLLVDWRVGVVCWAVFVIVLILTSYVSLSAIAGAICGPIGMLVFHGWLEFVIFLLCAALVIFKHKDNIKRLIAGTESKLHLGRERKAD
jgi:glycerol-3-phosphate acyltransferase PlsY